MRQLEFKMMNTDLKLKKGECQMLINTNVKYGNDDTRSPSKLKENDQKYENNGCC